MNGWYNHALTVRFPGTDATSGIDSCTTDQSYNGPDTRFYLDRRLMPRQGRKTTAHALAFKYDATVPQVSTVPARQPNGEGWYNAPLTVNFAGSDATAGLDVVRPREELLGTRTARRPERGACRDNAGNIGAGSLALKYDATAPQATASPGGRPNAQRLVQRSARGQPSPAIDPRPASTSCDPAKTYSGPDSANASLGGTCLDQAGNSGEVLRA